MLDKALLIVMAKWHAYGRCKNRLSKNIGKISSAKVQKKMTGHTVSVAKFLENKFLIPNSLLHLLLFFNPSPDMAKEISIKPLFSRNLATETVCPVIFFCTFAELIFPISFDNLFLQRP